MATANELIRDALIRHQISLQNLSQGLSQEAVLILDRTEANIADEIRAAVAKGATVETDAGLRKLQRLEDVVSKIRADAIDGIASTFEADAIDLVRHEAEFSASVLDDKSPTYLDLTLPDPTTLAALVTASPFEGNLLSEWFSRLADKDATQITDAVKIGLTRGLGIDDIVRMAIGSSGVNGTDGVTQITRNSLRSIIRTAVNAYSNSARTATFDANKDVIGFERYTATLDSHTTVICAGLDGTIYPVGEGKYPPQHWGCRSIRVAALDWEAVGNRPMKPLTEDMIVKEFADRNGIIAKTRADIQRGLKGAFDKFAQQRMRELTGTVAAKVNYEQFLTGQSTAFQNQVLGVAKAKLFRDGGVTLSSFVNRRGQELTLDQLATQERAAFQRAGLDPTRYTFNG
jgi:hypothetical protein